MFTEQNQNRIKYILLILAGVLFIILVFFALKIKKEINQSNQETTIQNKEINPEEKKAEELKKINDIREETGANKPLTDEEAKKQLEEITKIRQEQLK